VITTAAAAALIAVAVWVGIPLRDQGPYAVLEAADSSMYRISGGNRVPIRVGDRIAAHETLRTNVGAGAVLALADGSRIEIGSKSEMWWDRADGGLMVRLVTGSIIVSAAKEATGRLYVQTKDMTASVARATSLVNVADDGSSVAVIEGQAQVREGAVEKKLQPGEHLSTSPTLDARPLTEAIAWSRNADSHNRVLAAFSKGMLTTTGALTPVKESTGRQIDSGQRAESARPAGPAFAEASVRLCDPDALPATPPGGRGGGSGSFQMTPGRLNALCMRVDTLIGTAYGFGPLTDAMEGGRPVLNGVFGLGNVAARQVRGGPDWVRSDRYTIEAVAADTSDARTMSGPMLRDLFERRFQLAVHVESEPVPAFALTIAPGGLKMKQVDANGCTALGPPSPRGPLPPGSAIERARRGEQPFCGMMGETKAPNMSLVGGATGLSQLIYGLGDILGSRVIDRTEIPRDALFNFVLEFAPDERTLGPVGGRGRGLGAGASGEPRAPDIFTAFREQLGLQLEEVQAPRDYVVIDRIERPSPN
jgi:uncharacterized protein (TIGR03435 family)